MRPINSLLLGAAIFLTAAPVQAQTHLASRARSTFLLEFQKPVLTGSSVVDGYILHATMKQGVGETLSLVAGIPFVHWASDDPLFLDQDVFGNPYVGLEGTSPDPRFAWDLGVFFPTSTTSDFNAMRLGRITDLSRWESYETSLWSIVTGFRFLNTKTEGLGTRVRVAPTIVLSSEGVGAELMSTYSAHVVLRKPRADFGLGILGRFFVTSPGDIADRTGHELETAVTLKTNKVRPGLSLRLPLDDGFFRRDALDLALGLHVELMSR